jgi:hypothetical protein
MDPGPQGIALRGGGGIRVAGNSALFLAACLLATLLAGVAAFVSGLLWWGVCLLYEESRSPGWCDYLGLYFHLLWLAVFSPSYWAILRVRKSFDVQ